MGRSGVDIITQILYDLEFPKDRGALFRYAIGTEFFGNRELYEKNAREHTEKNALKDWDESEFF